MTEREVLDRLTPAERGAGTDAILSVVSRIRETRYTVKVMIAADGQVYPAQRDDGDLLEALYVVAGQVGFEFS